MRQLFCLLSILWKNLEGDGACKVVMLLDSGLGAEGFVDSIRQESIVSM